MWTNTCCSHPRQGETILQAARRRLLEEMGIDCKLEEIFSFSYCVKFSNGLTENELDHVLIGKSMTNQSQILKKLNNGDGQV
ncbi:MAG: NUDIX domain-containing protein [Microgenomates group bacterium]